MNLHDGFGKTYPVSPQEGVAVGIAAVELCVVEVVLIPLIVVSIVVEDVVDRGGLCG